MKIIVTIDRGNSEIVVEPDNFDVEMLVRSDFGFWLSLENMCDRAKQLIKKWEEMKC